MFQNCINQGSRIDLFYLINTRRITLLRYLAKVLKDCIFEIWIHQRSLEQSMCLVYESSSNNEIRQKIGILGQRDTIALHILCGLLHLVFSVGAQWSKMCGKVVRLCTNICQQAWKWSGFKREPNFLMLRTIIRT